MFRSLYTNDKSRDILVSTPAPPTVKPMTVWNIRFDEAGNIGNDKKLLHIKFDKTGQMALRFTIPIGSVYTISPELHTNYPLNGGKYDREVFTSKKFVKTKDSVLMCEFAILYPGPYQYYITYKRYKKTATFSNRFNQTEVDDEEGEMERGNETCGMKPTISFPDLRTSTFEMETAKSEMYYFLAEPRLKIKGEVLEANGIVLKTMHPGWLGPLSNWDRHLKNTSKLGYNMVHYLPIQARGDSGSPYSIYDQMRISDELFSDLKKYPETNEKRYKMLKVVLDKMEQEHGMLGVTDIVWNHTANNTKWLEEHPEAGYNLKNSPHLRAANEIDAMLCKLSDGIENYGFGKNTIENEQDLDKLMEIIEREVIQGLNLWEFYVIDATGLLKEVQDYIDNEEKVDSRVRNKNGVNVNNRVDMAALELESIMKREKDVRNVTTRFARQPTAAESVKTARALLGYRASKHELIEFLRQVFALLNVPFYKEFDQDKEAILTNIKNVVKFERLEKGSWKFQKPINSFYKIVDPYFTRLPKNATTDKLEEGEKVLANNGWIWGGDPLNNFAGEDSKAYLRREVIVWGDCVKLRYGKRPSDNPWLWDLMKRYTVESAKLFHGIRIDNCHSTPLELAEYLLDEARRVRPDLYVIAELFTGSAEKDDIYVSRLGINSLIRESLSAWDVNELGRMVYRNGGKTVGSLDVDCLEVEDTFTDENAKLHNVPCMVAPIRAALPDAMFFDQTHDNETPSQKRTAEDALSNAAVVCMSVSSTGSVHGYDELYEKQHDIVHEKRKYLYHENPVDVGIGLAKKRLNLLHREIATFDEVFVSTDDDFIQVHRINPTTREGYLMVAQPAFRRNSNKESILSAPIKLYDCEAEHVMSYKLEIKNKENHNPDKYLTGLSSELIDLGPPYLKNNQDEKGSYVELRLPPGFGPGSFLIVKTVLTNFRLDLDWKIKSSAEVPFLCLDLAALNTVLYRCEVEEQDTVGIGSYNIPGVGPLSYCGYEGWMTHLRHIIPNNDLGHPLCNNLRDGNWALDYVVYRLQKYSVIYPKLSHLISWLTERFALIKNAPSLLVPKYFSMVIYFSYNEAKKRAINLMNPDFATVTGFRASLAMTSVQLVGYTPSASLLPNKEMKVPSMAAGLPHFASHHMRCWGRDIFISLDGLLLTTHRWEEAREHLLAFASVLRNGLIPNLLDSGRYPRYNARDATWFWIQAVQDYVRLSPEGTKFLSVNVRRRFPATEEYVDWNDDLAYSRSSTVADIVYEILQSHATGISFREFNAGHRLDEHMTDPGFNISIHVDWDNGLLFGGNIWNCGTWMDKMGSSENAKNRGVPSTPRDGAAIEIVALLFNCLRWVSTLSAENPKDFPYTGVHVPFSALGESPLLKTCSSSQSIDHTDDQQLFLVDFGSWADLILSSFEKHFWIPINPKKDQRYSVDTSHVLRRGIYRDTFGSAVPGADYCFRPNLVVAMVISPRLFITKHARYCLSQVRRLLQGPLGMRTLDPLHPNYNPNYNNDDNSSNPLLANGANYHNGPEWLWQTGFYLRALIKFFNSNTDEIISTFYDVIHKSAFRLNDYISNKSSYRGLTELTNIDGSECVFSNPTQAWSSASILALLRDIDTFVLEYDIKLP